VAEKFNKLHKHVLETIDEILKTENSAFSFFYKSTYKVEGNNKTYPQYLMNRDGFSLLAMGFTGKKALAWKFKFIKAFNDMEAALKANAQTPVDQIVDTFNLPTTLKDAYLRLAACEDEKTLLLLSEYLVIL
jgi:Rha family phage regulatory protein